MCIHTHSIQPHTTLTHILSALNLRTLSVGQAPSQSWYSGLHSLAPCVGHLWKMNYYRASSTELSFAQGAATATAPAILLPLDPMPTHPREHPFSQESGTRRDLQARSSTMRRSTVAEGRPSLLGHVITTRASRWGGSQRKLRYFRGALPPHHATRAAAFGVRALGLDGRAIESVSFAPPTIPMATL